MTYTIPPNVTLEPDEHHHCPPQFPTYWVNLDGRRIGAVWASLGVRHPLAPPHPRWCAAMGDEDAAARQTRTLEDAVRWVLLQARPVVYRVKVHPYDQNGDRAHVYWDERPGMNPAVVSIGREGLGFSRHGYAVHTAHRWARKDATLQEVRA